MKKTKNILIAFLTLSLSSSSFAGILNRASLSAEEAADVENFIQTEVRADLNAHLAERLAGINNDPVDGKKKKVVGSNATLLTGEPMTPRTRAVLADAVYRILFGKLVDQGIYLTHRDFEQKIGKVLDFIARLGFFPRAFTVGYMGRLQKGVGGSLGTQFNFYLDNGKVKLASYSVYGLQVGLDLAKPAIMRKIEFYASFCFGSCVGGDATGYYLGLDGYAGVGVGGGAFIEAGLDVTDYFKYRREGKPYSLKDLYQAKAIYVGFGFDVGFGAGVSANAFYYKEDFEKTLGDLADPLVSLKAASLDLKLH